MTKFIVGAQVAIINRYNGYSGRDTLTSIAKVYKNGRFVTEAYPNQQFRPDGYGDVAHATSGGSQWHRARCVIADEVYHDLVAKSIAQNEGKRRWREAMRTLSALHENTPKLEDAAALEAIIAAIAERKS